MSDDYIVCLPVEISRRELLSKLYIALKAVDNGFITVVADFNNPVFDKINNGFYLHKDHAVWSESRFLKIKNQGLDFGCLDEEGLLNRCKSKYKEVRCSDLILSESDIVFSWGEKQAKLLKRASSNLVVSGNPRFDIMNMARLKNQTIVGRKEHRSVLINTRFGSCNNIRGSLEKQNLKELKFIKNEKDELDYESNVEKDFIIFESFKNLIAELSKNNNFKVTVRPHPSESLSPYIAICKNSKNIKVDNETELVLQILENDIIIHEGCTTAIESAAAGKIVLGLTPVNKGDEANKFANSFSLNFNSVSDIVSFLESESQFEGILCSEYDASEYIANWKKDSSFSIDIILKNIDELSKKKNKTGLNDLDSISKTKLGFKYKIKKYFKYGFFSKLVVFLYGNRGRSVIKSFEVSEHKFGDLTLDAINEMVSFLREMDPSLSLPDIDLINSKAFMVSKRQ